MLPGSGHPQSSLSVAGETVACGQVRRPTPSSSRDPGLQSPLWDSDTSHPTSSCWSRSFSGFMEVCSSHKEKEFSSNSKEGADPGQCPPMSWVPMAPLGSPHPRSSPNRPAACSGVPASSRVDKRTSGMFSPSQTSESTPLPTWTDSHRGLADFRPRVLFPGSCIIRSSSLEEIEGLDMSSGPSTRPLAHGPLLQVGWLPGKPLGG